MLFWIIAALLTLGACLSVLAPMARGRTEGAAADEHDIEVYRDQLAEIERDAARGLIAAPEAEEARAEIGRRILRLKETGAETAGARGGGNGWRWAGMAAVLSIPLVSWGVYATIGSPELPSQPLQARLGKSPAENTVEELIARAERHLAANPEDGQGWEVLAPVYMRIGRYADAVTAYRNAIRVMGATAAREAGLGEAIAASSGGIVNAEAQAAFERALGLEAGHPKARYFLATAQAQEGRLAAAEVSFQAMLSDLPAESPWRGAVEQALRQVKDAPDAVAQEGGEPGPGREEIEAAAQMSAEDRAEMIESMVASLDQRLRENPRDGEGWKRLVRSYVVLGRRDEALEALARGTDALRGDAQAAAELKQMAAELGLAAAE